MLCHHYRYKFSMLKKGECSGPEAAKEISWAESEIDRLNQVNRQLLIKLEEAELCIVDLKLQLNELREMLKKDRNNG